MLVVVAAAVEAAGGGGGGGGGGVGGGGDVRGDEGNAARGASICGLGCVLYLQQELFKATL